MDGERDVTCCRATAISIEPDDGIVAIGSGGAYALAAAKALAQHTALDARAIAEQAMQIAAAICIYSNDSLTIEVL